MLIVVKIGTDGALNNIAKISAEIAKIKQQGNNVILVSSGAVGFGKILVGHLSENKTLASVGQAELMQRYKTEFEKSGIFVSQILISKKDIEDNYDKIINLIKDISYMKNVIPIINENDTTAFDSFFNDNDEVAGIIARKISANKLIILTNVDGVYENYLSETKTIIKEINKHNMPKIDFTKSNSGRGGMKSKVLVGQQLSEIGIPVFICNVDTNNVLHRIIINSEDVGTKFIVNN